MISKDDIEHLKGLARVEFGARETEGLAKDLGAILDYVGELRQADVSAVAETTHALDIANVMRADEESTDVGLGEPSDIIASFPERDGNYLKVKAIFAD